MAASFWEKTKGTSKKGFDKAWNALDKLGDPVNRMSNRVGAEAFWPMTLDKESDKAARILRSFCKDGFYATEESDRESADGVNPETGKIDRPKGKQRVLKKIPSRVIKEAKGLCIFTTMRTGLWLSGSGGSGVLLGRIPETGEWSPPSGIMLHTAGIGFLAGIDIYDCVVVINTYQALEAFKKVRCTLGGEVSAAAGPVGMGGVLESEVHKRQAPIWTYMKSRGLYAGVQVDGTIVIERTDENERFYGERISVIDILAGKARHPPRSIEPLLQTVKAAQGDIVNENLLPPPGETPGDVDLQPHGIFGIPDPEDPDPFGVKALEAEGLFIREAATKTRPSQDVFEFKPSPASPIYATFRRSLDSSPRNSWRQSVQSSASVDRGTQTGDDPLTAPISRSRASSRSYRDPVDRAEPTQWDSEESRWDTVIPEHEETHFRSHDRAVNGNLVNDEDLEVHEVSSAVVSRRGSLANPVSPVSVESPNVPVESKRQSPTLTRARLVTIPKRPPPPLPPRNHHRASTPTSTPASPVPSPSPYDTHSVTSEPQHVAANGLTELPSNTKDESGADATSPDGFVEVSTDKDEFHSASDAQSLDAETKASTPDETSSMGLQRSETIDTWAAEKASTPDEASSTGIQRSETIDTWAAEKASTPDEASGTGIQRSETIDAWAAEKASDSEMEPKSSIKDESRPAHT